MAITITVADVARAVRAGSGTETTAEITRLLGYATAVLDQYVDLADVPDAVADQAVVMLVGYTFDRPTTYRYQSYANLIRNSGVGSVLLAYRVIRAGNVSQGAVADAQAAVGTLGNPVVDVTVNGTELVVTFADGTTEHHNLPAGSGGMFNGVDQTARDSIFEHEASPHNTDTVARSTARNARTVGETAQTAATTAQTTANTAQVTANTARTELTAHEATPHGGGGGGGGGGNALPTGSDALDQLRWRNGGWTAISAVTQTYAALTRLGTFASLKILMDGVRAQPNGLGHTTNGILTTARQAITAGNDETYRTLTMDQAWPAGESAPYVWVLTPSFHNLLPNFTVNFRADTTAQDLDPQIRMNLVALVTQSYQVFVDGVPYDVGLVQVPLTRPPDTQYMYMSFSYAYPADPAREVTQVATPAAPISGGGGGGGGGFPTTRTQVFTATAIGSTQLGGQLIDAAPAPKPATEAWLPNQLYELVLGGTSRHIILSNPDGAAAWEYALPDNQSNTTRMSAFISLVPTIGSTDTTTDIGRSGAVAGIDVEVNKLT